MIVDKGLDPEGRNVERVASGGLVGCGCLVLLVGAVVVLGSLVGALA